MMEPKPAYINGRFLTQRMTGTQRFAFEISKALQSVSPDFIIVAPRKADPVLTSGLKIKKWGIGHGILWEQVVLPLFLFIKKKPLILSFGSPGPVFYRKKISTVHDMAFMAHPDWFARTYYLYYRYTLPIVFNRSQQILTVSAFSKNEIIRYFHVPTEKITVVYNAVPAFFNIQEPPARIITEKYFLSVSSRDPRKNPQRILQAFIQSGCLNEYRLVFAGESNKLYRFRAGQDIDKRSLGYVSDEKLLSLYHHASLFIYLSFYEGFGIPPLEAMAMGCPVILSDIPVFHEIYGDAPCYVDPYNNREIGLAMQKIMTDREYRSQIIRKGYDCVERYNWIVSAGKVIDVVISL